MELEEVLKERINSSNIFDDREKEMISNNLSLCIKMYLLGILDANQS